MAKHARNLTSQDVRLEVNAAERSGLHITIFDVAASFGRIRPVGRRDSKHGYTRKFGTNPR